MYFDDYPKEPIGGGNPYQMCVFCGKSAPAINGILDNHSSFCEYRQNKERLIRSEYIKILKSGMMWELYPNASGIFEEDLSWFQLEIQKKYKEGQLWELA